MIPTFLLDRYDMKQQVSDEEIKKIILPVLESQEVELVDIEVKGRVGSQVLRIFVDKEGGITLDQCTRVSREISDILDITNLVQGKYRLEVSSPGIDRPLKNEKDFRRNINRKVKIVYLNDKKEKRTISGTIQAVDINSVSIQSDKKIINILLENIQSAKILLVW